MKWHIVGAENLNHSTKWPLSAAVKVLGSNNLNININKFVPEQARASLLNVIDHAFVKSKLK